MIKASLIGEFKKIVGKENVLTSKESLKAYSYDGTNGWIHEPDVVLFPTSTAKIAAIIEDRQRGEGPRYPERRRYERQRRVCSDPGRHRTRPDKV